MACEKNTDTTLYVLGAGFSKAFVCLPVTKGFLCGCEKTLEDYREAKSFVDDAGFELQSANIETLLTLASMPKPWLDAEHVGRFAVVAAQLKKLILEVIAAHCRKEPANDLQFHKRRKNKPKRPYRFHMEDERGEALESFAKHLLKSRGRSQVMSFNYDVVLENVIELVQLSLYPKSEIFHEGRSYGFNSNTVTQEGRIQPFKRGPGAEDLLVLKMHGSVNWFARRGYGPRVSPSDVVVHSCHDNYLQTDQTLLESAQSELEDTPFIVPPLLDKASLMEQPVLNVVWSRAAKQIRRAKRIVFMGYSFPPTDYYAEFLFRDHGRGKEAEVVDVEQSQTGQEEFETRFRAILGGQPEFKYRGAVNYCQQAFQ